MPQGRRKVPFSAKAKKEQLKAKKLTKSLHRGSNTLLLHKSDDEDDENTKRIHHQSNKNVKTKSNRYALKFYNDTPEEIQKNKELAGTEIKPVLEKNLEILAEKYFPENLNFPIRPKWSYGTSAQELEIREQRYFTEYLNDLEKNFDWKNLSYFELNLETWRQLWRVLEMSDIVLFIIDIRYAALMFPPLFYIYVTQTLHKDMILVLNKIDLAPPSLVVAWKHYFQKKFPKLNIVLFTTMPGYNLRGNQNENSGLNIRRRKGRIRMAAEGAQLLFESCQKIVGDNVNLSSWKKKIEEEISIEYDDEQSVEIEQVVYMDKIDTTYYEHEKFKNNILTIGCIGQPNVGKSSLMNAIMGKKVVSVSKTPGHTKHFQTIFLTPNVRLCDCPGLVFPSLVPKPIQVLMGSYPIAQLRDPYSTIRFLAERINLINLLKLTHPTNDDTWSVIDICDGWAKKRGFLTAKAARFDIYRAANHILRMALDGKICLCLYPPEYFSIKAEWKSHPDIETVQWIQAITDNKDTASCSQMDSSEYTDEEEQNVKVKNHMEGDQKDSDEQSSEDESCDEDEETVTIQANKFALLSTD